MPVPLSNADYGLEGYIEGVERRPIRGSTHRSGAGYPITR
jgi:hypothetical protein